MVGGGGALLAVPTLVYVLGVPTVAATGGSLVVVGASSLIGALGYARRGFIDTRALLAFGLPSIAGVWVARAWCLPALPHTLAGVPRDTVLMVFFAGLMLLAAWRMLKPQPLTGPRRSRKELGLRGFVVGGVTGMVGAGGGFLIVPALALGAGLGLSQAVATSLAIIALNSGIGLVASVHGAGLPETGLLLRFGGAVVVGMLIGLRLAPHVPGEKLRPVFAWFIGLLGLAVLAAEFFK